MTTGNFLHAYAEVEFSDTDDNKWFFNSPENPFLTGVSIVATMQAGGFGIPTMTVSFAMPYREGVEYLESGMFREGNKVAARIGYVGGIATPWWWGTLNQGGDGVQLTTDGLEGGVTVQAISGGAWNDLPAPDLKGKTGATLYRMVAQALGCKMVMAPQAGQIIIAKHNYVDLDAYDAAPFAWSGVPASKNAWDWLLFLNSTYNLCTMIAFGDDGVRRLYVLTSSERDFGEIRNLDGVPRESINMRTYRLRGPIDQINNQYPIFTWGPDPGIATWDGMLPPGGGGGVFAPMMNTGSGDVLEITAPVDEQGEPVNVGVENPDARNLEFDETWFISETKEYKMGWTASIPAPPPPTPKATDDETIKQEGKKVAQERQGEGNAAQKGTIATIGLPDEFPGNICNIQGCSKRYNGTYCIWNLTHQYAGGVWDMTLVVQRNGVGGDGLNKEVVVPLAGELPAAE